MPNPVKRHSKTRTSTRRAHDFLKQPSMSLCPQCNEPKMPHRLCPKCGTYKGREVIAIEKISGK
jgi:large subunit ribosomal protein L32